MNRLKHGRVAYRQLHSGSTRLRHKITGEWYYPAMIAQCSFWVVDEI